MYFHHALTVREDICFGCFHCMNVCPTEAIRVIDGKASIYENRCIDCGECFNACPVSAIVVEQDDFKTIFDFKHRVALLPSLLLGQFPNDVSLARIKSALIEIGFTHVFESALTYELHNEVMSEYLKQNSDIKPLISPFCPAIVRLIQVKFPSLIHNIAMVKPSIDFAAIYARKTLTDVGAIPDEIGVFYITPCAAKIAAIKSPVGEKQSAINGSINLNFIYNKIYKIIKNQTKEKSNDYGLFTKKSISGSLTNGETNHTKGRCLAIDEIHNVIEFLEKIENEEIKDIDFLELRACDESCAGGILTVKNRFLAVEKIKKIALSLPESVEKETPLDIYKDYLKANSVMSKIKPRSMLKLDENMVKAMSKMKKVRRVMCYLPGFDCGACGAPNCQALAEDIAQKKADISNCVFMQMEMMKHKKLSPDHAYRIIEKIWGKGRLDKNCKKKGAQNENS